MPISRFQFIHLLAVTCSFAWGTLFFSSAPYVSAFQRLLRHLHVSWVPISSIMHCYIFRILRYLDDCLVLGSSFQEIVQARDFLLWLFQELGIRVSFSKSSLTPSQTIDYLGMRLQTCPLRVFPTSKHVLKLSSLVLDFVSCRQQLLTLMSVTGSHISPHSRLSAVDATPVILDEHCRSFSRGLRRRVLG